MVGRTVNHYTMEALKSMYVCGGGRATGCGIHVRMCLCECMSGYVYMSDPIQHVEWISEWTRSWETVPGVEWTKASPMIVYTCRVVVNMMEYTKEDVMPCAPVYVVTDDNTKPRIERVYCR